MDKEPVLIIVGGMVAVTQAVLALIMSFGVDLTNEQTAAIMGLVTVVTGLIAAVLARGKVVPAAKVEQGLLNSYEAGKADVIGQLQEFNPPDGGAHV